VHNYLAFLSDEECYLNLSGNYNYLEWPYYVSQDMENDRRKVIPSCREMLDAYVTPVFLEKAKLNGLAVPGFYITNGYFEPPVIVDTVNPFMHRTSIVLKAGHQERVAKSLTRNFTYSVCCQEIPPDSQIKYFRSVLGWSISRRFRESSAKFWEVFRIPLAYIRVIIDGEGRILLSNIMPFQFHRLNAREHAYLKERIVWRT